MDFEFVMEELETAVEVRVMQALVRSSLGHGADNMPAVLLLTEKALFYGGRHDQGGRFHRVPLSSVTGLRRVGKLVWESIELRHMEIDGEKRVYICPFMGEPATPKKDVESMDYLLKALG